MSQELRKGMPKLPRCMKRLPIDERGYPVPWFVAKVDGVWDFRVIGRNKVHAAVDCGVCWITGKPFKEKDFVFVVGPLCILSGRSSEPPSLMPAAEFAVKVCPFLTLPKAVRRSAGIDEEQVKDLPGFPNLRNPGIVALWVTRAYQVQVVDAKGGVLLRMGKAKCLRWFKEGVEIPRSEVANPSGAVAMALKEAFDITFAMEGQPQDALNELRKRYEEILPIVLSGGEGLMAFEG